MLIRILLIISLLVAAYKGLERFGVLDNKPEETQGKGKFKKLLNDWDKPRTTDQIGGKIQNINSLTPQDLANNRKKELRSKFPDISLVFGADNYKWVVVLKEEDFTILRELRSKLDQSQEISEEDIRRLHLLEEKGLLQAIKNNKPESLNSTPGDSISPPQEENPDPESINEPEPNYDEPDPDPEPTQVEETISEPVDDQPEMAPEESTDPEPAPEDQETPIE